MALAAAHLGARGAPDRRRVVEARLSKAGPPPAIRRTPPPEGRLGADEGRVAHLRSALAELGPVFASFGRYLGSRIDLLPRRVALELSALADLGAPMSPHEVDSAVAQHLGAPLERRFFAFERAAESATLWTTRHRAWIAPGVPVLVTLVRPDAARWVDLDVPLLPLLAPWVEVAPDALAAAADDFALVLRRRLDQTHRVSSLAALAADHSAHGGFAAASCYRDHCGPGILTIEPPAGPTLDDVLADLSGGTARPAGEPHAQRLVSAWLRQAFLGRVVPVDFEPRDVIVDGERLILIGGVFEPHSSGARAGFLSYVNAVAADDPDEAAAWIVEAAGPDAPVHLEAELRRRFRQAVPFRDGEWSGDDRLAEHVLVQWRVARESGWPITPHHLHLYRGLLAVSTVAARLAPREDTVLDALQDWRLQQGMTEARRMLDPRQLDTTLDRLLQGLVHLPQKLDNVLTLAAEGRLRVKLQVPDGDATRRSRNRTILLVATLVALTGLASVARQFAPLLGADVERLAALVLLVLGGWLLVAAART